MAPHWLAAGCLCALMATACSGPISTEDTLIVTRADQVTSASEETTPTASTTAGPVPPLKLTEMNVRSEVALRYASTYIVTNVRNPANRAQETTFRVLLPETAYISGFTMTLDGKPYKAYVKEKEEAKQIYSDAVNKGQAAAHIATKARDSNQFTVSVNVEPNTAAVFNLTYEELLVRRNNVYNHAVNLHPGAVVPKLTVTVHIKELDPLTTLRVPQVRTGNEVDATEQDPQNSVARIEQSGGEATITFSPDLEEQRRLMDVYNEKSKESEHEQHYGYYGGQRKTESDGVLGQFVVQYDVDRPAGGKILVNDEGYFVHFFAPTSLPTLSKHVVFVLDTSGSMSGRKIDQLHQAMDAILSDLNPGDYFSIVEFASSVVVHDLKGDTRKSPNFYVEGGNKPARLLPPSPATADNVRRAKEIVKRMSADGGTNISSALSVAVDLVKRGVEWKVEPAVSSTTPKASTEGQPETEVIDNAAGRVEGATVAGPVGRADSSVAITESSTTKADDKPAKKGKQLEPIIIFLTDGEPTVGEYNTKRIIDIVSENNSGHNRAQIFSLAFGEDADRGFLRKLSLRNAAFARHIYEAADAALQLRGFWREVASPLLADVAFVYPPGQVKAESLTKHEFRALYAGAEAVVAGRLAPGAGDVEAAVLGWCGVDDDAFARKKYEVFPKLPKPAKRAEPLPLERLWAYLTIKDLLDQSDALDATPEDKKKEGSPEQKALKIALQYSFVTPLTSLVVVKPNDTKAVNAESVDSQNEYPMAPVALSAARPSGFYGPPPPSGAQYFVNRGSFSARRPVSYAASHRRKVSHRYAIAPAAWSGSGYGGGYTLRLASGPGQPLQYPAAGGFSPSTTMPPFSTTPADLLAKFHLTNFPWLRPILSDNGGGVVTVQKDNSTLPLNVVDSTDVPKEADGDKQCAKSTDGNAGVCVYLTRCAAAKTLTVDQYSQLHCTVTSGFAGVCCPQDKVDVEQTN